MKALPALVVTLALGACASMPVPSGDDWAAIGEATRVGPVVVRPDRVIEDNRCPMNARCITAGRVVLDATIWIDNQRRSVRLQSDQQFTIAGGALSVDAIIPDSFMTDDRPQPADYQFRFAYR